MLFLDLPAAGRDFHYPLMPLHVNCYGGQLLTGAARGAGADAPAVGSPPSPTPARCFALGAAIGPFLAASPWRAAIVASSSWSHGSLTAKHQRLYPDVDADRRLRADLDGGDWTRWGELSRESIEDAGQHEVLNWICLAGAMAALGQRAQVVDFVESWVFNSSKCFARVPARLNEEATHGRHRCRIWRDSRRDHGAHLGTRVAGRTATPCAPGMTRWPGGCARRSPDVVLMVGADHFQSFFLDNMPAFCLGVDGRCVGQGDGGLPRYDLAVHAGLAHGLLEGLIDEGFDLAFARNLPADHAFMTPVHMIFPQADLPIVPLFQNCNAPPLPTVARCLALGGAIRRVLADIEPDLRVALIGTGGLSHAVPLRGLAHAGR